MYKLLIFCLFPLLFFPQKSTKSIDSLINVTEHHFKKYEDVVVYANSKKIIEWSEKLHYPKGKIYGNYYISSVLYTISEHKKSLDLITKIKVEKKKGDYQSLYAKVYRNEADNYFALGLYNLAVESNHKALAQVKENNTEHNLLRSSIFANLNDLYYKIGKQDSSLYYLNKEKENLKLLDPNQNFSEVAFAYVGIGEHYTREKKVDSAEYYLNKSIYIYSKNNNLHSFHSYFALGDLYFQEKDYSKALENYQKALEILKKIKVKDSEREIYKKIANTYAALHRPEENEYMSKYVKLNDSLSIIADKDRSYILNETLKEKDDAYETLETNAYKTAAFIALIVLFLLVVGFLYFKKFKKKAEEIEHQSEQLISEKDILLKEKEEVSQELYQQQHSSLDELINLAKTNDAGFLAKFEEVYPHFAPNLLKINPTLVRTELKFCALLFFNFSIKDIAEYTFTSPKTVQNRKNRIRKRLEIPLEENINLWMQKMVN